MHLLGKKFWAFAIKSNGDTVPLIKINQWDFRWQYFYTFKKMQKIPAGSTIFVYGTYDNTKNNPLNPVKSLFLPLPTAYFCVPEIHTKT